MFIKETYIFIAIVLIIIFCIMKKHMKRELYTIITQGGIPQRHKGIISTRKKIANLSLLNPQVIPLNPHITE
jgi:hypothetical protein